MVENDPKFHRIEQKAGRVINVTTGAEIKMDESEEYVDMCQAIRDIREEGRQEGRNEGKQREKEDIILRMLRKGTFTYEEIAELIGVSVDKVKAMGTQLGNWVTERNQEKVSAVPRIFDFAGYGQNFFLYRPYRLLHCI